MHERLACSYSYNSSEGTFLWAVITEISCVISDSLVPYVQELLCHTVRKNGKQFTLQFDETVIAQNQTTLDLLQP